MGALKRSCSVRRAWKLPSIEYRTCTYPLAGGFSSGGAVKSGLRAAELVIVSLSRSHCCLFGSDSCSGMNWNHLEVCVFAVVGLEPVVKWFCIVLLFL